MTTPSPSSPGPDSASAFVPEYQPPAWYLDAGRTGDHVPWHSVMPAELPEVATVGCRICGAGPVAPVRVRSHQGLLVLMRWQTLDGPFCATCGTALVREMTTRTLWQGWWGPLSLLAGTPVTLLSNLSAYRQLKRLPTPTPTPGRPQAVMGKPVFERPLAYVALIPLVWTVWLLSSLLL